LAGNKYGSGKNYSRQQAQEEKSGFHGGYKGFSNIVNHAEEPVLSHV
jgi:hypothetical protein